jgi:hypothetical protein
MSANPIQKREHEEDDAPQSRKKKKFIKNELKLLDAVCDVQGKAHKSQRFGRTTSRKDHRGPGEQYTKLHARKILPRGCKNSVNQFGG